MSPVRYPRTALRCAALAAFVLVASSQARAGTYRQVLRSTGWVSTQKAGKGSSGTCWLLNREQRLAVTNAHVVAGRKGRRSVFVFFPLYREGRLVRDVAVYRKQLLGIPARVAAQNRTHDLALLRLEWVPPGVRLLPLARWGPRKGDRYFAIGNSSRKAGKLWRFRKGKVSKLAFRKTLAGFKLKVKDKRPARDAGRFKRVFFTKPRSHPGDSGGPAVNGQGRLIGVTVGSTHSGQGVCIHLSEVRKFLKRAVPRASRSAGRDLSFRPVAKRDA